MGITSQVYQWFSHGKNSDDMSVTDWFAFVALVIITSFLWSKVIYQIVE